MGRIKKAATSRHEATLSPVLAAFIKAATTLPLYELPRLLASFPSRWPFPRGDLYHWIPVLDRFDLILERFNEEYGLSNGPQVEPFRRRILLRDNLVDPSSTESSLTPSEATLDQAGFGPEGDRQLVEQVLVSTRVLLENCGNRSLYSSSSHLNNLLNTTSLSLLKATLRLCLRLAQRYHASRMRLPSMSQHNSGLLGSHYNINLDKLHKLSLPFLKYPLTGSDMSPTPKAKEGAYKAPESAHPVNVTDVVSIIKATSDEESEWTDLANVWLSYYDMPSAPAEGPVFTGGQDHTSTPPSSSQTTPSRRTSNLGPSTSTRQSQSQAAEDQPTSPSTKTAARSSELTRAQGLKGLQIPHTLVSSSEPEQLVKQYISDIPQPSQYEFLTRVRISHAFGSSAAARHDAVCIRLLAIANLAYIHPESTFQQKLGQQDSDEPRQLQLATQLSELLHPPRENEHEVSREIQTLALCTLEALTKHKGKAFDVSHALSVSVNHGIFFYLLRKAALELCVEDESGEDTSEEEWRDALFSLLMSLPSAPARSGESMVSAGLLDVLISALKLRTSKAERSFSRILTFLDTYVYNIRDAFQALVTAGGLDVVADLFAFEVESSFRLVERGEGFPKPHWTQVTDFKIPFHKQQTLRWLTKFTNHMLTHGATGFDRLLRNLVSAPHLLDGLRTIIANARTFGSNVWSGSVSIMSSFIHNEPTSYAIVAEAGLSKVFLESITQESIPEPPSASSPAADNATSNGNQPADAVQQDAGVATQTQEATGSTQRPVLAQGILPSAETIQTLPQAFGAICLIEAGMKLFQRSKALPRFFEIFHSPEHVKAMKSEQDLPILLGNLFDELVRHHPQLKTAVMSSVLAMIIRITRICFDRASKDGVGAALWVEGSDGQCLVAGGRSALQGSEGPIHKHYRQGRSKLAGDDTADVEMTDDDVTEANEGAKEEVSSKDVVENDDSSHGVTTLDHINVASRFLNGFFQNHSLCSTFIELGGAEHVLDLATLPCWPYAFKEATGTCDWVAQVIQAMLEQKPHLVLPSLLKRLQMAIEHLAPLLKHDGELTYFAHFTTLHPSIASQPDLPADFFDHGTTIAKSLVTVNLLCGVLSQTFQSQIYNHRSMSTAFSQVNLGDAFARLIHGLGKLHQTSVWEELVLQKSLSPRWREATRIKSSGVGTEELEEIMSMVHASLSHADATNAASLLSTQPDQMQLQPSGALPQTDASKIPDSDGDKSLAQFKNVQAVRYLLGHTPTSITSFFQGLGKMLLFKRSLDSYQKQTATLVADQLAKVTLEELKYRRANASNSKNSRYAYWMVIMTSLSQLMVDNSAERAYPQTVTLVLQAFKNRGGFVALGGILDSLLDELKSAAAGKPDAHLEGDAESSVNVALAGIKMILSFYSQVTHSKCVTEATQTSAMASRADRDREKPDFFLPAQFLVEIRMAVMPSLRKLWESEEFMEQTPAFIVKILIETLRIVLEGEAELGAFKRSDKLSPRSKPKYKLWRVRNSEYLTKLIDEGFEEDLATEALYRCYDNLPAAREYCAGARTSVRLSRQPIPPYETQAHSRAQVPSNSTDSATPQASENTTASEGSQDVSTTPVPGASTSLDAQADQEEQPTASLPSTSTADDPFAGFRGPSPTTFELEAPRKQDNPFTSVLANGSDAAKGRDVVTVEDLDEERTDWRKSLIDRSLDVLNIHDEVTFELADLIFAAVVKASDPKGMREEIGETVVQSLVSLQLDEDFRPQGKKIAAYAHLLALLLQDKDFFDATLSELRANLTVLVDFIKHFPGETAEGSASVWVSKILLVIERLLAEDAQPHQIKWTPPSDDHAQEESSIVEIPDPIVAQDQKQRIFASILEVLPHVGKDESLALAIVRALVILTRNRQLAIKLGERRSLQKLFVMIKQLSGFSNEKLQGAFLIVLRHIIEDEDTIRQIMRSEIRAMFDGRQQRQTDTTSYTRQMYHLVLRAPDLFVEVTNELLMLVRFDTNQRPQALALKPPPKPKETSVADDSNLDSKEGQPTTAEAKGDESGSGNDLEVGKSHVHDTKAPVVDNPDGVIHYLLCELLSYKDVVDKELPASAPTQTRDSMSVDPDPSTPGPSSAPSVSTEPVQEHKKHSKVEFKPEQHPIYIYRCFLLQCLTELLACYNRTKVEFINFSRKADPHMLTPSKPRSKVLDYLLNVLIPVGTLSHAEDLPSRKRASTSNWAMSVVVSLCSKTGERGLVMGPDTKEVEDEPELLYVRKFVLEHALKAFKDANSSNDPPDQKYSHLLNLADLFHRMLTGKPNSSNSSFSVEMLLASQKQLAKLMFEKNFIAAFTACLADMDLNFPGAKRAVKYILRPLRILTQTALELSASAQLTLATSPRADEEGMSTASSVSDMDESREETPDLFRNSTLAMYEPGRDQETDSGSDEGDEDGYGDEYADDMEYDEEDPNADGDVVSDEDEGLEGLGAAEGLPGDMDVEVVIEGEDEVLSDAEGASEDMDDLDDDDEDEDDEDEEMEIMDEINGDDESAGAGGEDEDEWASEDEDADDYLDGDETRDNESALDVDPLERIVQVIEDAPRHLLDSLENGGLEMDIDQEDYPGDDMAEDDDEEDEEDDYDEEDLGYEPDFGDHVGGILNNMMPWAWNDMRPTFIPGPNPHAQHPPPPHHHHRGMPWGSMLGGGPVDRAVPFPPYRAHRHGAGQRGTDDGTNPLLQRSDGVGSGPAGAVRPESISDWMDPIRAGRLLRAGDSPVSFISNVINAMSQGRQILHHRHLENGGLSFTIGGIPTGGPPLRGALPLNLEGLVGIRRTADGAPRAQRDDPAQAVAFVPALTVSRWQDEARLLFGNSYVEKTQRVINAILRLMVPPAIEAQKAQKEEQEKREKAEAEARAREQQEREAKERKECEEREAAEIEAAARAREEAQAEQDQPAPETSDNDEQMRDADSAETSSNTAAAPTEAAPSAAQPRITTTIRGRELDITGMGIDIEYLEALPEELREEVLMQQVAEQRSQAVAAGEEPTDISREFLEALPADIRDELLQQEAQDRRRREREEARRRNAGSGSASGAHAEEMDAASFLASLDPSLRQSVLMEQDEEILAHLPDAIRAEARALGGDRRLHQFHDMPRISRPRGLDRYDPDQEHPAHKLARRQAIQILDKAGVATLLRLMFIPQQGSSKQSLNGILQNICENKYNRVELVSILLSILQDGSTDPSAVERCFVQLSHRAKQAPVNKTPQPAKRPFSGVYPSQDMSPLTVVQQCLTTLDLLARYNPHIAFFFLTEREGMTTLRSRAARKGKGAENKASRYPLNALLSLLDRKIVVESVTVMEQLVALLLNVTLPLNVLLRKEKEKSEGDKNSAPAAVTDVTTTQDEPEENSTADADTVMTSAPDLPEEAEGRGEEDNAATAENKTEPQEAGPPKKTRVLAPPDVPDHNLRLIVNLLAARECSSRAFRDTLSVINNMSAIPGAKEVFGQELVRQAQELGKRILHDLEELVPQIIKAESGTDIQGLALSRFSPGSSDQAKLLRIITALDYLFDPKRADTADKPTSSNVEGLGKEQKQDILINLCENSTFGPLWSKLSECLTVIRQRGNLFNVATILLPLIEVLMVVCKNTTLKEAALVRSSQKERAIYSPPPDSLMENMFFTFTEDHRKILNDLVRHNPRLMSGSFALLVKNSKVLEFDNKRNYFTRKLHSRGSETRHPHPPLQLSVRREQVFLDSFKSLYYKSAEEMKYGKLTIRFHGEEGVDAGGVTREWFQVLSRQMFNPDYALFINVASDRTTFHPNRLSSINQEHLLFFKFIGRIIGKALYEGRVLDCHFSRAVYKRILGKPVSVKDMETLDLDFYKSLLWMLENDITDIITETFSVETEAFGVTQTIDLLENGRNVSVTEENKHEYVRLLVEYRLTGSVQDQLEHFLKGFHDIVPPDLVSIFSEQELELLISGLPDIDVDDWRNNTEYQNYTAASPQIQWFWRAVRSFDKEERAKLLQFVTGTSKVPLNGFKELEGMNGISRFNIHRDYGTKDRLPSSHTCFNQLDLPEYESYEALRQQVHTAITAGSEYFGFA